MQNINKYQQNLSFGVG